MLKRCFERKFVYFITLLIVVLTFSVIIAIIDVKLYQDKIYRNRKGAAQKEPKAPIPEIINYFEVSMNIRREFRSFDFSLCFSVIILTILGIMLIGSATDIRANGLTSEFKSQIMWAGSGIAIMLAAAFIDFRFVCRFFVFYYFINILLLVAVLVIDFGLKPGVPARSIFFGKAGPGVYSIQPSEFNKLFMLIFLAKFVDMFRERINKPLILCAVIGLTCVPVALILKEPSLSASIVTFVVMAVMLITAKLKYRYIVIALAIILPVGMILLYDASSAIVENVDGKLTVSYEEGSLSPILSDKLSNYQVMRIKTFLNPVEGSDEYFQSQQAMLAIRSGKLSGKGLFGGEVYVPEAANDFIFTTLAEDFGFVGCIAALAVMLLIVIRCMIIAKRCEIFYGKLIAAGTGGVLAFQTFTNVAVNTEMVPNTGMIFPFISSGGSAMWVFMAMVGLTLSIGMTKTKSMFED